MVKRTLTLALLASGLVWGEPTGPQIIHGGVNIQSSGPTTLINQSTDRAIINWNGFNIDVHELVRFVQPSQLSVILNRVVGTDPSVILGQLQANGQVFLINPNGVVFGPSARVDVGGLMATTLNLTDQDFLAGRYHLTQDPAHGLASVVNQGELRVADGGFLLLVAPLVDNQGMIVARAGQVGLVGASDVTLNFDGQGLVEIRVPQTQLNNPGTVALAPDTVSDVLRQVVADPGIVEAGHLPRGEGLLVQEGRVEAQRVLLNSTQATLVAPGSNTSAAEIRILSNGLARTDGNVRGNFVELSGSKFFLGGSLTANQLLLDPDTIHVIDSDGPAPLDSYLPNILLANDAGINLLSRGSLESLSSGTQVSLEAQNLIQVDDMALNQINLAPDVSIHMTVHTGDIIFQDSADHLFTTGGGSFRFDAPNGSISLGQVTAPGGSITVNAGADATFHSLSTFDLSQSRTPGQVSVQAGNDIILGSVSARNTKLKAGNDILSDSSGSASVQGTEASFEAGNLVGTSSKPIFVDLQKISGEATSFNFNYEQQPAQGLVNGIDGLNILVPAPTESAGSNNLVSLPNPLLAKVDQVPVFQIGENTSGFAPPPLPPEPPSPPGAYPANTSNIDQPLVDALAFVSNLPGYAVSSQQRVADSYSIKVQSQDIMPLYEGLVQRGWVVHMTGERLVASRDGMTLYGSLNSGGADLQVHQDRTFDFGPLLSQLQSGRAVQIEVDQFKLVGLLEALGEQGWRAHLTNDHLEGRRQGQSLHGLIQGSQASLQIGATPIDGATNDFAFLTLAPGMQKTVQVCDSQKFVYQLGPEGLMPFIEALAARGYRVRATDERLEAWKGEDRVEGLVSGQRLFLKVGPQSCFAVSNDDADLTGLLAWLASTPGITAVSQSRMVDSTRYRLQTNLKKLTAQLARHGWTVRGNTAVRGHYRMQLKPRGNNILLTLTRMP
ncbi:filamentous hemagglutinin N-terminal domain-containing protein [bacterium]|nr:filamentous hemagglutinin N-terminal domain-containing protein [bacterium]